MFTTPLPSTDMAECLSWLARLVQQWYGSKLVKYSKHTTTTTKFVNSFLTTATTKFVNSFLLLFLFPFVVFVVAFPRVSLFLVCFLSEFMLCLTVPIKRQNPATVPLLVIIFSSFLPNISFLRLGLFSFSYSLFVVISISSFQQLCLSHLRYNSSWPKSVCLFQSVFLLLLAD